MEDILRAIVLGIVQGLTEFLPISSSGHLIITREIFGWEFEDELALDVALHFGTTAAVLAYFWREWQSMALSGLAWLRRRPENAALPPYDARLLFLLLLGTIPAGLFGLFQSPIEDRLRNPFVAASMLIVFAAVLYWADRTSRSTRKIEGTTWRDALWIGASQAVALIPGVSRSGITISTALKRDFDRESAARFCFLLSTPVIVAASLLESVRVYTHDLSGHDYLVMAVGASVAAVVGWVAMHVLLRYVRTGTYTPFVIYRLALGVFLLLYFVIQ